MNNLIFCSASFHIKDYSNVKRENEYLFCLNQLIRFIPNNFKIAICDNSIKNINDLKNKNLIELLNNIDYFFILNRNIGNKNIGMGELDELIHTYNNINFNKYEKIIYFTLRKILTNPWLFEKVNLMKKDALISNPKYLHINNNLDLKYLKSSPNLYNDMFFCLKSNLMIKYVEYSKSKIKYNLRHNIGSEQNLYKFINEHNIDFEWLNCLGLIRIDYKKSNEFQLI